MPPATKAKLLQLGALLYEIPQSLPTAKREKIDAIINELAEGVVEPATSETGMAATRPARKAKRQPTEEAHTSRSFEPIVLTVAEKRRTEEFR